MTTLAHRPDLTELLDAPAPDRPTLAGNLRDIRLVNRALGFAAAVVREVAAVTARIGRADWTLLDVATGSADIPLAIVRGDRECLSIAAASIVAKVTRDRALVALGLDYPAYGFDRHKGYGTPDHQAALRHHGPSPQHRQSFAPLRALPPAGLSEME